MRTVENHNSARAHAKMSTKFFLLFISTIYAYPLPNVQINNVYQQQTDKIAMELYKNILIKNLIVTSDNLKLYLNMERSNNFETNEISSYLPDYDITDSNELLSEKLKSDTSFQKMTKRQIGGLGGAGGDTQVVLGTFQAMMRPMSTSDIPGLGQNSATQTSEVKENSTTQKGEEI